VRDSVPWETDECDAVIDVPREPDELSDLACVTPCRGKPTNVTPQEAQVGRIKSRVEFCLGERRCDRSGVGACGYKIVSVKKKRRRWSCMAGRQKSYVL